MIDIFKGGIYQCMLPFKKMRRDVRQAPEVALVPRSITLTLTPLPSTCAMLKTARICAVDAVNY